MNSKGKQKGTSARTSIGARAEAPDAQERMITVLEGIEYSLASIGESVERIADELEASRSTRRSTRPATARAGRNGRGR